MSLFGKRVSLNVLFKVDVAAHEHGHEEEVQCSKDDGHKHGLDQNGNEEDEEEALECK